MKSPFLILILTGLLSGCATHILTTTTLNPPPEERFSAFNHFELTKVALAPAYVGPTANEKALAKIQEDLSLRTAPVLEKWNASGIAKTPMRTLLIEPTITEIKFINGSARFWAGPLAGSSAVIIDAKISEKESGKVIATPMFFARAEAWGGSFTIGATDNLMLSRIANRLADYLLANYDAAVGGVTGADSPEK